MSSVNGNRRKRPKTENTRDNVTDQFDAEDFTQRRVLRSGYLSIQNFIRDKKDEIAAASTKKFQSILNEVDGMHHLVKAPREQVSDAAALQELANTLVTSVRVHTSGGVTPTVFISSLLTEYGQKRRKGITGNSKILWKDLGLHVSPLLMINRGSCTMLGPMLRKPKPPSALFSRKPTRKLKDNLIQPEEIEGRVIKEMTDTDKIIATMFEILKSNTDVCLESIILNRISFAQTVENLFALSFLVKDGRVMITVDEKGSHHVSPRNSPASSMIMSRKVVHTHFIFDFNFNDWKLMKDLVAEGSELMPHRTKGPSYVFIKSEPNFERNNSRITRTTMKTVSRNLDMDFEEELKPDVIHETGSNGHCKRKR